MYDPLSPKSSSAKDSVAHFTLNSDLFTSFLSTHCGRLSLACMFLFGSAFFLTWILVVIEGTSFLTAPRAMKAIYPFLFITLNSLLH